MFFDGILSCPKGAPLLSSCFHSPLLSSCFYPPSPSDNSINEVVIAKTEEELALAKRITKIESQRSCFNATDETDYEIAVAKDPAKKYVIIIEQNYDRFAWEKEKKDVIIIAQNYDPMIGEVPDSEVFGTTASSLEETQKTSSL